MAQMELNRVTRETIYAKCPMFKAGQPCPYATPEIKALVKNCPDFKNGKCPFWDIKDIGELKERMGKMRETCSGNRNYTKALELAQVIYENHSKTVGQCPIFKHGSPLVTDADGNAVLNYAYVTRQEINRCPMFKPGHPCPYATSKIKALVKDCPEFKNGKCAFRDVKSVGDFKMKLAQMRDQCKGKAGYNAALKEAHKIYEEKSKRVGACPLFKFGSPLETDLHGKAILG